MTAPAPGFHGVSFRTTDRAVRTFGADELPREARDETTFVWVDVQAEDPRSLAGVLAAFGIDAAPFSHLGEPEILPRIVESPRYLAFHLYEIEEPERHLDTSHGIAGVRVAKMLLVLGKDFVLTWHRVPLDAVDEVRAGCADAFRLAGKTPGFIAFLFLQRCLYDYAHLNLANDNYLDDLEPCVRRGDRRALLEDVRVAAQNILTIKKLAASLHIVLMILATKRSAFVSDEGRATYQTMLDNAASVRASVDSSRELLDGVLESLQAEAASRTSEIATVLTVISAVMLPLTLVAGIYGMNFEDIPFAAHPHGFWWLCGSMAVGGAALVLWFRRLGWIGGRRR